MGTRSLTHIKDAKGKTLLTLYRQYDGYPSGVGLDLAKFIESGTLVNGLGRDDGNLYFNGMGCFAAALVSELKDGPGHVYVYLPNSQGCWEEYTYEIQERKGTIQIRYSLDYDLEKPGKVVSWTPWYTGSEAVKAFLLTEQD